jgi:hypothetical protein
LAGSKSQRIASATAVIFTAVFLQIAAVVWRASALGRCHAARCPRQLPRASTKRKLVMDNTWIGAAP